MKVLHTSDWHLGRSLYGRKCYNEFQAFLEWLITEIDKQQADCLLIAGDIFDTTTPSNSIQNLYYSFLYKITKTCCRHVVIIGGNHDSPSLLNAPKQLLGHLHVTVVGSAYESENDEVITLYDPSGKAELIVCAVPYLRDRDVRKAEAGESIESKAQKLLDGISRHYQKVIECGRQRIQKLNHKIPLVAMGHLFAAGGKTADNNEVRDLYIGTLAHVHSSIFPDCVDYLALGHLHIAQRVDQSETMRYCGSPLQLSFGKGNSSKSITIVDISIDNISVNLITVPPFLRLLSIAGEHHEIMAQLDILLAEERTALLEITYTGNDIVILQEDLEKKINGSKIELLKIVNRQILERSLNQHNMDETLEELSEVDVFRRCLDAHEIADDKREELEFCFREVLETLAHEQEEESQK